MERVSLTLALFLVVLGVRLIYVDQLATPVPFWDQWYAEASHLYPAWIEGRLDWQTLVARHNEHRILFTRLIDLGLLEGHGVWDPVLQMVVNAFLHACFAVLLYLLFSRVVKGSAWTSFAFVLVLTAIPFDFENMLAGFQSQFELMFLFSLAALWTIAGADRPLSWRWWLGWILLVLALGTMAGGLFPPVALSGVCVIQILVESRYRDWRLWVGAGLLMGLAVVALAFHLPKGGGEAHSLSGMVRSVCAFLSWPLGAGGWGWLLVQLPFMAGLVCLWRRKLVLTAAVRITLAMSLWVMVHALAIAFSRSGVVIVSRYLSINACGVVANIAWGILLVQALVIRRPARMTAARWLLAGWGVGMMAALVHDFLTVQEPGMKTYVGLRKHHVESVSRYLATGDDKGLVQSRDYPIPPSPDEEELKRHLKNQTIVDLLPAATKPPAPGVVIGDPGTFVGSGGLGRQVDAAPYQPYWGSFLPAEGEKAKGVLTLEYPGSSLTPWVEIWMAGAPSPKGTSLEIQDLQGRRKIRIIPDGRPGQQWRRFLVRIPYRPFRLKAVDAFDDRWFAFTEPRPVGRWERQKSFLLERGGKLVLGGAAIVLVLMMLPGGSLPGLRSESTGLPKGQEE